MGKGIGIAALVIVIVSFVVPFIGNFVAYFALVIASIAALMGEKTFAIATTVIAFAKMFFMSPLLMASMYLPFSDSSAPLGAYSALILTVFFVALPIVCMLCRPAIRGIFRSIGIQIPAGGGIE